MTRNIRAAIVTTIVVALLWLLQASAAQGAQSEVDAINAVLDPWIDAFTASVDAGEPVPDTIEVEAALIDLWNGTVNGSACDVYAGYALGVVDLVGMYGLTGEIAYLRPAYGLYSQLESAEYACLIEA